MEKLNLLDDKEKKLENNLSSSLEKFNIDKSTEN